MFGPSVGLLLNDQVGFGACPDPQDLRCEWSTIGVNKDGLRLWLAAAVASAVAVLDGPASSQGVIASEHGQKT